MSLKSRFVGGIARNLFRMGFPGEEFVHGSYLRRDQATVFPRSNQGLLQVDPGVELHDAFFNLTDAIVIEKGVILGHQVMFLTGKHDMEPEGARYQGSSAGVITIEQGAWIASRAIILGGVTVGRGAVIGAGSVVTKDVPAGEFWAGNPARFIRPVETLGQTAPDQP